MKPARIALRCGHNATPEATRGLNCYLMQVTYNRSVAANFFECTALRQCCVCCCVWRLGEGSICFLNKIAVTVVFVWFLLRTFIYPTEAK
jgi:uncharacterized membrane protein